MVLNLSECLGQQLRSARAKTKHVHFFSSPTQKPFRLLFGLLADSQSARSRLVGCSAQRFGAICAQTRICLTTTSSGAQCSRSHDLRFLPATATATTIFERRAILVLPPKFDLHCDYCKLDAVSCLRATVPPPQRSLDPTIFRSALSKRGSCRQPAPGVSRCQPPYCF